MPNESEQKALSQIKDFLEAGHSLDALRQAGWGDWITHLEGEGYDFVTDEKAVSPPDGAPPMRNDAEVLNDPVVQARRYVEKDSGYSSEEAREERKQEVEQLLRKAQAELDSLISRFLEVNDCELCRGWLEQPSTRHHYWLIAAEAGIWVSEGAFEHRHREHLSRWWHPVAKIALFPLKIALFPLVLVAFAVGLVCGLVYWLVIYLPWQAAHSVGLIKTPGTPPGKIIDRVRGGR